MAEAGVNWEDLDAIAVTKGPGLAGSLLVGVNTAKAIALAQKLPLIGVNHLEGHIYANWLTGSQYLLPGDLPHRFRRAQRPGFDERTTEIILCSAGPGMMPPVKLLIRSPESWVWDIREGR